MSEEREYIIGLTLAGDLGKRQPPDVEHERQIAIYDLVEVNTFKALRYGYGPYQLELAVVENRLIFRVMDRNKTDLGQIILSLTPFKRSIRDYRQVYNSYNEAIRTAHPSRIEAIDMARRSIHNEAAELLMERLEGKVELDLETARRFFTLITTLYMKNQNDIYGQGGSV